MNYAIETMLYDDRAVCMLFTDSPAAAGAARAMLGNGAFTVHDYALADARDRLAAQASVDLVVVEVAEHGEPSAALETTLTLVRAGVEERRFGAIVIVPPSLLDLADALAGGGELILLSRPTAEDRDLAIAAATLAGGSHATPFVHDMSKDGGLRQLREEVNRLARTLATLAVDQPQEETPASSVVGRPTAGLGLHEPIVDAVLVRAMIRARRLRDHYFPSELFADPALDMLLDLTAARLERRQVAVSSLCIASAVPPTTALRWIKTLTDEGLFVRIADPRDGRRVFIELDDPAADGMLGYLAAAKRVTALPV